MLEIVSCNSTDNEKLGIIADLANEIWNEHYGNIISKEQIAYMVENLQSKEAIKQQILGGYQYYLIQFKQEYLGYLGICFKEGDLFLSKLYIKAKHRGKGYGKQAVEFAGDLAKKKSLPLISLTVCKRNTNTIKAYEKIGFSITEPIVIDIGNGYVMDDYKMQKYLA